MKKYILFSVALVAALTAYGSTAQSAKATANCYTFTRNLSASITLTASEAAALQADLAQENVWNASTTITSYTSTVAAAVTSFQEKYSSQILAPNGMTQGNGYFGDYTRAEMNRLYGCQISSATSASTQCPPGYTCTPIAKTAAPVCPTGYTCTPIAAAGTSSSAPNSSGTGAAAAASPATSGGSSYIPGFNPTAVWNAALSGAQTDANNYLYFEHTSVASQTPITIDGISVTANCFYNSTSLCAHAGELSSAATAASTTVAALTAPITVTTQNTVTVPLSAPTETCSDVSGIGHVCKRYSNADVNSKGLDPYWTNKSDPNGFIGEAETAGTAYKNPWLSATYPFGVVYSDSINNMVANKGYISYIPPSNLCKNPVTLDQAVTEQQLFSSQGLNTNIITDATLFVVPDPAVAGGRNDLWELEYGTAFYNAFLTFGTSGFNGWTVNFKGQNLASPVNTVDANDWFNSTFQQQAKFASGYSSGFVFNINNKPGQALGFSGVAGGVAILARCLDTNYVSNFPQWQSYLASMNPTQIGIWRAKYGIQ